MSKIHLETLDKSRLEAFQNLSPFKKYGYLAGGTALSLQITHRKSFDFDVFVKRQIDNKLKLATNPLIKTEFLDLASVADISADKAITIGRRAVWRDYVDFFVLLKEKYYGITEIINFAKKKFKGEFNEALFLQQLTYFKDVEEAPIAVGKLIYRMFHSL